MRVKPTTVTYGIILDGLYRAGRTAAAKKMFDQMIKSGITVTVSIYTTPSFPVYKAYFNFFVFPI